MELVIENISKKYGEFVAVDNVNLHISNGVNGLLGANGSGKTSLMRVICGVCSADGGRISLDGIDVTMEDYRARLGYLPQDFGYYPSFTAEEYLMYISALKGLSKAHAKRKTAELLDIVGLSKVSKKKMKTFSGGMKQRIGIAQALLNSPDLLVVDEPTAGLDPSERKKFRDLISNISQDTIVLLSTHIVSDIEQIADKVIMMQQGRIIYDEPWNKERKDLEELYMQKCEGDTDA